MYAGKTISSLRSCHMNFQCITTVSLGFAHMNDLVTVAICNFNTTELTNNCIRSIKSMLTTFTPKFTILDNSNQRFFHLDRYIHATVIDNTHNKFINFNLLLKQSPYKLMPYNANNYGSFKHACSI